MRVETQAHNVHRLVGKGDRNFSACEVGQALRTGRGQGAFLASHFVVVGQCPQFHAVGFGAFGQGFGGEGAVRDDGVAVQVGVHHAFHFRRMPPERCSLWGHCGCEAQGPVTALQFLGLRPVADNPGMTSMQTFAEPQPWH